MIDYYAALAKERGLQLIAEAEAERMAAQVRQERRRQRRGGGSQPVARVARTARHA